MRPDQTTFFPRPRPRKTCSRLGPRLTLAAIVLSLFGASVWAQSGSEPRPDSRPDPKLDRFKKEGKEISKPAGQTAKKPKAGAKDADDPDAATTWVIIVGAFSGDDQTTRAADAARKLALQGLTGVTAHKRGKATVLEYGSYAGREDKAAIDDLARVRDLDIDGQKQLAGAFLAPPAQGALGAIPEFNLSNALKDYRGKTKPIYTLQVAVYARDDDKAPTSKELAQFRQTAEEAAAQLRREGETAFYYHGPNRSMVTVGLFGPKDSDPLKPGSESMALRELRDRYKYNLLNGKGIKETQMGANGKEVSSLQPSFLVAIPKS